MEYLHRAAEGGHVGAVLWLAYSYNIGAHFDSEPEQMIRKPDLVEAFAWHYARRLTGSIRTPIPAEEISKTLEEKGLLEEAKSRGEEYYSRYLAQS